MTLRLTISRCILFCALLAAFFAAPATAAKPAAETGQPGEAEVRAFFDALMDMASYDRHREFYEKHVDTKDIAFDNFRKHLAEADRRLLGSFETKFVGWERSGKRIVVTLDAALTGATGGTVTRKRVHLPLAVKNGRLFVASRDLFKMLELKKTQRRNK